MTIEEIERMQRGIRRAFRDDPAGTLTILDAIGLRAERRNARRARERRRPGGSTATRKM